MRLKLSLKIVFKNLVFGLGRILDLRVVTAANGRTGFSNTTARHMPELNTGNKVRKMPFGKKLALVKHMLKNSSWTEPVKGLSGIWKFSLERLESSLRSSLLPRSK